jgi:thiamine-monophosphate kinase
MIDVSDGLSSDLSHICEESGAGAEIYAGAIPLSGALTAYAGKGGKSGVGYALAGGEDYEILFTAPPARLARLRALRIEVTQIGRITRERGIRLIDEQGRRSLLEPSGYDHFRQPRKKKGGRR